MRFHAVAAVVALTVVIAPHDAANSCGTAHASGQSVYLKGEQVVIIWDPVTKIEHFVRRAQFSASSREYGFIVPVPSVPEVVEVTDKPFDWLMKLLPAPRGGFAKGGSGGGQAPTGSVTVHSTQNVGDYEVTVLSGMTADAVRDWLKEHGYEARAALTDWFKSYVAKKWKFAAFKFNHKDSGPAWTKAIRLSFKTAYPYYPYKAPVDDWPEDRIKPMTVYFISDTEYDARFLNSRAPWDALKVLTGLLKPAQFQFVVDSFQIAELPTRNPRVLTVFQNYHNAGDYAQDLEFYVNTKGKVPKVITSPELGEPQKILQQAPGVRGGKG